MCVCEVTVECSVYRLSFGFFVCGCENCRTIEVPRNFHICPLASGMTSFVFNRLALLLPKYVTGGLCWASFLYWPFYVKFV